MPLPSPVVWIVDDDPDDQYLFELTFNSLSPPVNVRLLNDGADLLPALIQSKSLPSLILLDLNMPRMDGFQALRQLRANPAYRSLPVVVLTTSTRQDERSKALEFGANGVLTKAGSTGQLLMLFTQLVDQWKLS